MVTANDPHLLQRPAKRYLFLRNDLLDAVGILNQLWEHSAHEVHKHRHKAERGAGVWGGGEGRGS